MLELLKKEIFSRGGYNKMKMRKIGPSEILRNFLANEYELELLACIGIFPIFNVIDLYPYIRDDTKTTNATQK